MAGEFERPEETLASKREREENRRFAESLKSSATALQAQASSTKLLLPKLILERKSIDSKIAMNQKLIANDAILLQVTRDRITSAQGELTFRKQLQNTLSKELEQRRSALAQVTPELSLAKMQEDTARESLAIKEQELKTARDNLAAKTAGRDVTQSELDRVMTLYADQVNADILAGKGASEAQKALRQRRDELTSALGLYQEEIQTSQASVLQLTDTTSHLQAQLHQATANVDQLSYEVSGLTTEIGDLEDKIKENDDALAQLPVEIQGLTIEAQKLADGMQEKQKEIKKLKLEKLQSLSNALVQAGEALIKLRDKIYDIQQQLGTTFGTAINVASGALVNRVTSFFSSGPILSFQESIDAVNAFQQEFGGILKRGEAQKIAQAAKTLGVSAQVFLKAQRNFLVVGGDVTKNTFIGQFRAAGLTAASALKFAAENANLVAIAGSKYANELARAAANAQRIGVGLDRTEALADGIVGDFEGALERFSELRAMGVEVDFNKLAAVAGTGTPQEVLSELQGQLGGNQQLLQELQRNRFLKVALERDLGLNVAEITRLAAGETAKAPEQTQEEKDRTARDMLLERVGTVTSGIGKLIGAFIGVNAFLGANTMATNANTLAVGGQTSGMISKLTGMVGKLSGLGSGLSGLAKFGIGGAGVGIGIGGSLYGRELVKEGKTGAGIGLGTLAGLVGGGLLAVATGGAAIPFLLGGAALGGGISATGMIGRAKGGLVTGPGTATSDSILTPLSSGEFVINAAATKRLGVDALSALNAGASLGIGRKMGGSPSITRAANFANNATAVGISAVEKGAVNQFVKNSVPYVASLGKYGKTIDLTRDVTTVFGKVGKYSPRLLKELGKNLKVVPVIGSILGGLITGYDEYKKSGSLTRAFGKGGFSTLGGLVGSVGLGMLTAGNPIAASLGAIGGSMAGESAFDKLFGEVKRADDAEIKPGAGYGKRALLFNDSDTIMAGTKLMSPGTLTPVQTMKQQQPEVNNVVNVNMDKMEAKLDRLAAAFSNIKIEMDGNTVGRVTANSRSSIDRLAVVG